MAEFPLLALWTDAYLADTNHLSTVEHGAYLLMLIHAWRDPTCSLPFDDKKLASITRLDKKSWNFHKEVLLEFWQRNGKRITQARLLAERKKARRQIDQKRSAGLASAAYRLNGRTNGSSTNVPTASQRRVNPLTLTLTPKEKNKKEEEEVKEEEERKERQRQVSLRDLGAVESLILEATEAAPKKKTSRRPESFEEFMAYCQSKNITEVDTHGLYSGWEANGWTRNGKPLVKWKAAVVNWKLYGYLASQKKARQR